MTDTTDTIRQQALAYIAERITITDAGCHEWQGSLTRDGYGQFGTAWIERVTGQKLVHRAMYALTHNHTYADRHEQILHACDNRACCNPDHLSLGSAAQNIAQAAARSMTDPTVGLCRGSRSWRATIDESVARLIKQMIEDGWRNVTIARELGVSHIVVSNIRVGRSWRHVTL